MFTQELSTLSTGFSTGKNEKHVDKSVSKSMCRKNSTVLYKSTGISSVYIILIFSDLTTERKNWWVQK